MAGIGFLDLDSELLHKTRRLGKVTARIGTNIILILLAYVTNSTPQNSSSEADSHSAAQDIFHF
jgi:hypothetical protein